MEVPTISPVRVVAEIGINHDGSTEKALALIRAAADARVWGVKFQYRNLPNGYGVGQRQIGDEILSHELHRAHLPPPVILELASCAQAQGLRAGISFFNASDTADFAGSLDAFDFFKVPSVEMTNRELVLQLASLGRPCFLSTGAQTEKRVGQLLPLLSPDIWTVCHCVANYPAHIVNAKLGYIRHLRRIWPGPVGYSSHDQHWETCLLAMQLGASVIERHITLDPADDGLDHSSSSTPDEFEKLSIFAENMALLLAGDGPRQPNQGELLNLQNLGRSFYARRDIAPGQALRTADLDLRPPRIGLGQEEIGEYIGKPAIRAVPRGSVIDRSAFAAGPRLDASVFRAAEEKRLALPVRFHDYADLSARFPIRRFEFHLTFRDLELAAEARGFSKEHVFSVHLPDYVSPTLLIDPFSQREDQRSLSAGVIQRTVEFVSRLEELTGQSVPIVGSFSAVHSTLAEFHSQLAELVGGYRARGVEILPQWLPPVAWYFGGAVRLRAMNGPDDLEHIKRLQMPICLDTSHLFMGCETFELEPLEIIEDIKPWIRHVHVADAAGLDGEGLAIGASGDRNLAAMAAAMSLGVTNVIEVWQGHLNGGEGFARALESLAGLACLEAT